MYWAFQNIYWAWLSENCQRSVEELVLWEKLYSIQLVSVECENGVFMWIFAFWTVKIEKTIKRRGVYKNWFDRKRTIWRNLLQINSRGNLRQKYSKNIREITWKYPRGIMISLCNFIKITPRHGIFPRNFQGKIKDIYHEISSLTKLCILTSCENLEKRRHWGGGLGWRNRRCTQKQTAILPVGYVHHLLSSTGCGSLKHFDTKSNNLTHWAMFSARSR